MNADYHLVEFEDQFPDAGKLIVREGTVQNCTNLASAVIMSMKSC